MCLNVFTGVNIDKQDTSGWDVKEDIEWIKNCPLPKGETFMRLDMTLLKGTSCSRHS